MLEREIEIALKHAVERLGGRALKFISPGLNGVPDRLVLLPGGKLAFVEVKAPGKKMRPLQIKRKSQLEALGILVYCVDSIDQIGGVLDAIKNLSTP
ncbi:MAG: VRR-NUC domain-containing protein [Methanothrix sp.]|nr:MAG: VRR-NUC domain-containing protein [Methanothrix sp.]